MKYFQNGIPRPVKRWIFTYKPCKKERSRNITNYGKTILYLKKRDLFEISYPQVNKRKNIYHYCSGSTRIFHPNHVKSRRYPIAKVFWQKNRYIFNNINNINDKITTWLMGVGKKHLQLRIIVFPVRFEQSKILSQRFFHRVLHKAIFLCVQSSIYTEIVFSIESFLIDFREIIKANKKNIHQGKIDCSWKNS